MTINYTNNAFGNLELADGTHVRLIEQAFAENHQCEAAWFARGYLSTENADDETGPTVEVRWESLDSDDAETDADWDTPVAVTHYSRGELKIA